MTEEKAIFGAGCFWGVEERFSKLPGVISTQVGYSAGNTQNPSYEDVCSGDTGHAEVCEVTFNLEQISYEQLLDAFWQMHDPTTLNRQGPDLGSQYRSGIYYTSSEQKLKAESSKVKAQQGLDRIIVTEIEAAQEFYKAEEYHQQYIKKRFGG